MAVAIASLGFVSCELDNYDGPDAQIYGAFYDVQDGSLVEQDIARGTQICFQELGYEDPQTQYMLIKNNGEYRNNLMFSGQYDFFFNESNFVIPERIENYKIKPGENRLDFTVQPYIRISNVNINKEGNEVVATFTVTPTVGNNVKRIGLFGHIDYVVGDSYRLDCITQEINAASKDIPTTYSLRLGTSKFDAGSKYYFRVGALIDNNGAKYNYAPAVRIQL